VVRRWLAALLPERPARDDVVLVVTDLGIFEHMLLIWVREQA
jgi:hypothetical protein